MNNLKPLFDRVVIKEEPEDVSIGNIFIGSSNQDNIKIGTVICVGDGNDLENGEKSKMYVKPNDRVVYSKFSGMEAIIDKQTVFIIRQTDILAIINE